MRKAVLMLAGMICGAIVGAAAGLLLAPQSGEETQKYLEKRLEDLRAEARQAYEARRKELMDEYERARQGIDIPVE